MFLGLRRRWSNGSLFLGLDPSLPQSLAVLFGRPCRTACEAASVKTLSKSIVGVDTPYSLRALHLGDAWPGHAIPKWSFVKRLVRRRDTYIYIYIYVCDSIFGESTMSCRDEERPRGPILGCLRVFFLCCVFASSESLCRCW